MKVGRIALAVLLCLAVAPGQWWRSYDTRPRGGDLIIEPLPVAATPEGGGPVLAGAWHLAGPGNRFRGYSALVLRENGRLRAYSDHGLWLEFQPPDRTAAHDAEFGAVRAYGGKIANDIEAAVYDPASDTTWLALEFANSIRRIGRDVVEVAPPSMAGFRGNGGAEAMVRLSDGRFVVLAESARPLSPMRRTGLLFPGDPASGARATEFAFDPPPGYDPTDAAVLPDGRVLILLRALTLKALPFFESRLVIADPAEIAAGEPWPWREVAHLSDLAPRENYEGLAIAPDEAGLAIWLISDANNSVWLQRTLLLKLVWKDWRDAREAPAESAFRRALRPS